MPSPERLPPAKAGSPSCPKPSAGWLSDGFEVVVERGAGAAAGYPDEGYAEAGATLREAGSLLEGVDTIVRVARPTPDEVSAMAPGRC